MQKNADDLILTDVKAVLRRPTSVDDEDVDEADRYRLSLVLPPTPGC